MVNGAHLYRAVIPKGFHRASLSPASCCGAAIMNLPAPLSAYADRQCSIFFLSFFLFFLKSTSVRKIPPNWFCPHHHWYFISVCLSVPHLLASLLFLLLFAKCPEFPSVLRICAVLQPSSPSSPTPTGGLALAETARNLQLSEFKETQVLLRFILSESWKPLCRPLCFYFTLPKAIFRWK